MELLFDLKIDYVNKELKSSKKRKSARAVIIRNNKILVLKSINDEVKLPGGGVDENETYEECIYREVREETGYEIKKIRKIGELHERRYDKFNKGTAFILEDLYFLVSPGKKGNPDLQGYEIDLGFEAVWMNIDKAISINEEAINKNDLNEIAKRELLVFKEIKKIITKKNEQSVKNFINKTLNGMTYGLFATLIISVIISQVAAIFTGTGAKDVIDAVAQTLKNLMGIGIGIGIALSLKQTGIRLVSLSITGGIATTFKVTFSEGIKIGMNNDPMITYFVVVLSALFLIHVMKKSTNFDILLVPLSMVVTSIAATLLLSAPTTFIVQSLAVFVETSTSLVPFLMSIVISVVMGMILTAPISSAAIAITINLNGIAAGAAVVGCCTQMVGFAIQSIRDNKVGTVLSVAFGTSMLQFKNIIKKPVIWVPTILASAILGPIGTFVFHLSCNKEGAGMGTSGFVGILQTLNVMNYSAESFIGLLVTCIVGPVLLTFIFDFILRRVGLIKKEDLNISRNI